MEWPALGWSMRRPSGRPEWSWNLILLKNLTRYFWLICKKNKKVLPWTSRARWQRQRGPWHWSGSSPEQSTKSQLYLLTIKIEKWEVYQISYKKIFTRNYGLGRTHLGHEGLSHDSEGVSCVVAATADKIVGANLHGQCDLLQFGAEARVEAALAQAPWRNWSYFRCAWHLDKK